MDLAADFSVPLPMLVIAEMLGVPAADWPRYKRWSDVILKIANTFTKDEEAARTIEEYRAVTAEMRAFLPELIAERRAAHRDDLLTRLVEAEVDGERLTEEEVLGFVQLLLVGGQETTANLINNAVLCFSRTRDQLARLQADARPAALRDRGGLALPLAASVDAPRDAARRRDARAGDPGRQARPADDRLREPRPQAVPDADRFDITRDPNPHIAFGHGIHACLGAPLARLEARIALADFLKRVKEFELASDEPWEPRKALRVHGPSRLPIRFTSSARFVA